MGGSTSHGTNRWTPRVDNPDLNALGTSGLYAVQNVAELSVLDTAPFENGAGVAMRSVLDIWLWNQDSVLAPDGITVVAAVGGGNWVRQMTTAAEWLARATWFIDGAAGDDENDGALAGTALATFEELWRRTGGTPAANAVVTVVGAAYSGSIHTNNRSQTVPAFTSSFTIIGQQTVLYSGSITALQAWSPPPAVAAKQLITDAALPVSWTASGLVGKRLVLTSGANSGAWAYVLADIGGGSKQAFVGVFWNPSTFSVVSPALNDTFDVVDVTEVAGVLRVAGPADVTVQDLRFNSPDDWDVAVFGGGLLYAIGMECVGVAPAYCSDSNFTAQGCYFQLQFGYQVDSTPGGSINFWGCSTNGIQLSSHGGRVAINDSCVVYNVAQSGLFNDDRGFVRVESGAWLGIFDCTSTYIAVTQEGAHTALAGYVWGTGNACTYFWLVTGGSIVSCDAATRLTALGGVAATNDVLVAAVAAAYAGIPATDAANLAGIVLTL